MRPLLPVAAVTLLLAVALGLMRLREPAGEGHAAVVRPPVYHCTAELTFRGMVPAKLRVPKDHEVHLVVSAATDAPEGILTIVGYADHVDGTGLGPGLAREIVFLSDRPGDDFAFGIGGEIVGRLEVTGDHLPEGHQ